MVKELPMGVLVFAKFSDFFGWFDDGDGERFETCLELILISGGRFGPASEVRTFFLRHVKKRI